MTVSGDDLDALGLLDYLDYGLGETKMVLAKELNRPDLADLSNEAAAPLLAEILKTDPRAQEIMRIHDSRRSMKSNS